MKLVLIDRDGVVNVEIPGYVKSPQELEIMPVACEAFALLKQNGFTCVVVTNQSVVGRGIITQAELDGIHHFLKTHIEEKGGKIDTIITCTDRPDAAGPRRKPKPGMLLEALEQYGADAASTPFIGDAMTDLEAAHAAGCRRYLVQTGKGKDTMHHIPPHLQPVEICTDILDAARKIIAQPQA